MTEQERYAMQSKIAQNKNAEYIKTMGQYFTPYNIAKDIVDQIHTIVGDNQINVLDPQAGSGVFYSALANSKCDFAYTGIEIDGDYRDLLNQLIDSKSNIYIGDFTKINPDKKYDIVVCNPPYIKNQNITAEEKKRIKNAILNETGISVSGLSDMYLYFVLLSHKWLNSEAVGAWVLPTQFLFSSYGSALKEYLLNKVQLFEIHYYDDDNVFDQACVKWCIVWYKTQKQFHDYKVKFVYNNSTWMKSKTDLIKDNNWISQHNSYAKTAFKIGDFFNIKRGIAIGDRNFFVLSETDIVNNKIEKQFLKPILPSPRYLHDNIIGADDLKEPLIDNKLYLLDCNLPIDVVAKEHADLYKYLSKGIGQVQETYLCKRKQIWYRQEQRDPTYFICSYMSKNNASPVRYIFNMSQCVVTNSYYMLYPKLELKTLCNDINYALQVYNCLCNIDGESYISQSRRYGNGLIELTPSTLENVNCDNLLQL